MQLNPRRFEWDEEKNDSNVIKHGFGFEIVEEFFQNEVLERADQRKDYGEERIIAIGQVKELTLTLVYTIRKNVSRIISIRKARRDEEKRYSQWLEKKAFDD